MKETEVNKAIQDYITAIGGYVVKMIVTNRSGVPDILCCLRGRFIAIEGKRPGKLKNVSDLQKAHINHIIDAGGLAFAADSLEMVIDILDRLNTYKPVKYEVQEFTL